MYFSFHTFSCRTLTSNHYVCLLCFKPLEVNLQKIENSYISLYLLLPFPLPFPILEVYWLSTASVSFDSIDAKFNILHYV